jgi:hypothetical protein
VVGPLAVWHAIWTPFAQPATIKKRMISCVISAGKVSPYSAPGIRFSYLQSVTFSTHCCAVVQRTPIALDSNDTTGSALLHPFTCSTAHAIAPDGSTANSHAAAALSHVGLRTDLFGPRGEGGVSGDAFVTVGADVAAATLRVAASAVSHQLVVDRVVQHHLHTPTVHTRPHPHAAPSGCTHRRLSQRNAVPVSPTAERPSTRPSYT